MNVSQARMLIETAEKYSREFQALQHKTELLKQAAVKAADDFLNEQVRIELCKLDLSELRRSGLAIRISAYKAAGIDNLGMLFGETIDSLSDIEGIGETSAQRTLYALNKIRDRVSEQVSLKLSVDSRDVFSDKLVLAVCRAMEHEAVSKKALPLSDELCSCTECCAAFSALIMNRLKWLFASSSRQSDALTAMIPLCDLLTDDFIEKSESVIKEAENNVSINADDAWKRFSDDSASFYAFLENTAAKVKDSAYGKKLRFDVRYSDTGGLPAVLYENVCNTELDLAGLKCTLRPYQELGVEFIINQKIILMIHPVNKVVMVFKQDV